MNVPEVIGWIAIFVISSTIGGGIGAWLVARHFNLLDDDD